MFERADLDTMSNASGFVLTPCTKYEVYGENYKDHYPLLINQMKELPKKSFYVGLPPINASDAYENRDCYSDYSLLYDFISKVISEIETLKADNKLLGTFRGFYFTTERVFGTVDPDHPTLNPMVKLMSDLADLIKKTYKKKFIWAPYLGRYETYYTTNENLGIVANRTSIFNTIFLQSGYYFYPDRKRNTEDSDPENVILRRNLTLAQKCAQNNMVYNYKASNSTVISNTPIGTKKSSSTQIGIDMEASDSLRWYPDTYKRYYSRECGTFSPLFINGTCPFLFYAGAYSGIIGSLLYQSIQEFYANGGYKLPTPIS